MEHAGPMPSPACEQKVLRVFFRTRAIELQTAVIDSPLQAVRAEAGNLSLRKSVSMRLVLFCVHFEQYIGSQWEGRCESRNHESQGQLETIMHHMAKVLLSFHCAQSTWL